MVDPKITKKLIFNTLLLSVIVMVICGSVLSFLSIDKTKQILMPQIESKEDIIASVISQLISKAITSGYPEDKLTDLDKYFHDIRESNKELSYIALLQKNGTIIYIDGDPCTDLGKSLTESNISNKTYRFSSPNCIHTIYPLMINRTSKLYLSLGINKTFFWSSIHTDIIDIITLLTVSLLVIIEFMTFMFSRSVITVLASIFTFITMVKNGIYSNTLKLFFAVETCKFADALNRSIEKVNQLYHKLTESQKMSFSKFTFSPTEKTSPLKIQNALDGRLPLFLIVFADSLSLSFLPLYVTTLSSNIHWLPEKLVAGLPITIFMLFWAIALPYAGILSDKKGRDIPFIIGSLVNIIGLIGTGAAVTFYDLLLWRAIAALGYGAVYIASQGYILDTVGKDKRTQGMAMFLSAFFAGSLCGSAIGGIIAERFGYRIIFYIAAVISACSALCVLSRVDFHSVKTPANLKKSSFKDTMQIFKDKHFLSVMFFSAIPAKICLVGFIYYTVPILLKSIGTNQGRIGQIIMGYSLPIVLFSPIIARFADKIKNRSIFIITGGYLSAFSLLTVYFVNGIYGILAGTVLLGMAHSIGVSSQLVFVTDSFSKRSSIGLGSVISLFRLIERSGNILGPIVAGLFISFLGFSKGVAALGILTLCGTILFWFSTRPKESDDNSEVTDGI